MDALGEIRELLPIWVRSGALALGVLPFAAGFLATALGVAASRVGIAVADGLVAHGPGDHDALALRAALLAQAGSCADAGAELARALDAAGGQPSPWVEWAAVSVESCGQTGSP